MSEIDLIDKAIERFAAKHPRPHTVNYGQACTMLGITRPTLTKLIASRTIKTNALGEIPITEIDQAIAAR
jgi:hypothetical protein